MQLNIELSELKSTLAKVIGAVQKKNTIPSLANIALIADGDTLTIKATDLDIDVTVTAQATVEVHGSTTVDAALLTAFVSKLPAGALVNLSLADHKLTVKAGRSKSSLQTLPIEDFPQMASADYDHQFIMQSTELARMFSLSRGAQSTEETRYYLQGVYFHPTTDNELCAVATDGHRLYKITSPCHVDFPGVIVPSKTVQELVKVLDIGEAVVSVSATKIRFEVGPVVIVSKVIDGTFPDYTRVIPEKNDKIVTAKAVDMKDASNRVATISDARGSAVKIELTEGSAVFSTQSASGTAEDQVTVSYHGEPLTIGFSAKYFAEVMAQCSGQDVTLELGNAGSPAIIRPNDDDRALYVVMPMRV